MDIQIRVEGKRRCGYRKEGGLYFVLPNFGAKPCGKLPLPLECCPCCGQGVKYSRGWTWINGKLLFKEGPCRSTENPVPFYLSDCASCILKNPPEKMGLLWIGEQFYKTPEDWIREGQTMGISRRIKGVPHGFKLGETWIAVAHIHALPPLPGTKNGRPAIFQVFRPSAIEYVVKEDDPEDKLTDLEKRGITLVKVSHYSLNPAQKDLFDSGSKETSV